MIVYISGKITGLNRDEAFDKFEAAEKHLQSLGHTPINPMKLAHDNVMSWHRCMAIDIVAMFEHKCEAVFFLDNWNQESDGALLEYEICDVKKWHKLDAGNILHFAQ